MLLTLLSRPSFCLSLYGSALWRLSSSRLRSLEVTFNNLLRKIWKLPRHCHTSILHCISSLQSLFNVIYRSSMLCQKARSTGIRLICDIFTDALQLSYTTFGFNVHNYNRYWRTYTDADIMCSNFIRDVKLFPQENRGLIDEFITCVLINNNSYIIFTLSFISITPFYTYCGVYNEI